jgi:hypothetical protein
MIPIGLIAAAVAAAARAASRTSTTRTGARTVVYPERRRAVLRRVVVWGLGVLALATGWSLANDGAPAGWLTMALGVVLLWPEAVIGGAFVPLGWPRAAWVVARLAATSPLAGEARASAALAAARAQLRRPRPGAARWIARDLSTCVQIGVSGAAAGALLALSRGDRDTARAVFGAIDATDPVDVPRRAAWTARDFLAVDAVTREDWDRVLALPGFPRSSLVTRLAIALARAAQGRSSWRPVWLAWVIAPRRRRTRALLRAVRARLEAPRDPAPEPAANLCAQAALFGRPRGSLRPEDVAAAVFSLDALRASQALVADVARRALAVASQAQALDAGSICERVLDEAERDLASFLLEHRAPPGWIPRGPTGDAVRQRIQEERRGRAEALARELLRRTRARVDLDEVDEWRAWGDLRSACDEVLRDAPDEAALRSFFESIYAPLMAYAVRLANVRSRRTLAREVFRFLHGLASGASRQDARDLLAKNVSACRSDRLPRADREGEAMFDRAALTRFERRLRSVRRGALACACLGFSALVAVNAFVPTWIGSPPFWTAVVGLLAATFFVAFRASRRATRLAEATWTADGLVLQTGAGAYYAGAGDVRAVAAERDGAIRIRLARAPWWLSPTVLTVAASPAAAQSIADRLEGLTRAARPGGREAGDRPGSREQDVA